MKRSVLCVCFVCAANFLLHFFFLSHLATLKSDFHHFLHIFLFAYFSFLIFFFAIATRSARSITQVWELKEREKIADDTERNRAVRAQSHIEQKQAAPSDDNNNNSSTMQNKEMSPKYKKKVRSKVKRKKIGTTSNIN